KNEKEFADLIVSGGVDGLEVRSSDGVKTSGEKLKESLVELLKVPQIMSGFEAERFDPRVLSAVLHLLGDKAPEFGDKSKLEHFAKNLAESLEKEVGLKSAMQVIELENSERSNGGMEF